MPRHGQRVFRTIAEALREGKKGEYGIGVDASCKEADGWYHADFYLSRPADEAEKPVEELLAPVF